MKILIVSDTHRIDDNYIKVIEKESPIDLLIHCGDAEGSENLISDLANCPVEIVLGNNDFFVSLPKEEEFVIGKDKVFLTHGHNYYVSMGYETIKKEAISRGATIVIFGHTHKPIIEKNKDLVAINPGSLTYPRQEGRAPSYVVMEVLENEENRYEIRHI